MGKPAANAPPADLYEADFFLWSRRQADLLRRRRWSDLDLANLAEEVESVGRSEKQEIRNRLTVLLLYLLKWEHQPDRRKYGWRATIIEQRIAVESVVEDSPSLRGWPAEALPRAYAIARAKAVAETNLPEVAFPAECPYAIDAILDMAYWPGPVQSD